MTYAHRLGRRLTRLVPPISTIFSSTANNLGFGGTAGELIETCFAPGVQLIAKLSFQIANRFMHKITISPADIRGAVHFQ